MISRRAAIWSLVLAGTLAGTPSWAEEAAPAGRVRFEFHSHFLLNLHCFLLDAARNPQRLESLAWDSTPTEAQMQPLQQALQFYREAFDRRDPLFDDRLSAIRVALSRAPDAQQAVPSIAGETELVAQLRAVAPLYAQRLWASQDRQNQNWIQNAQALDSRYGAEIQAAVERYMHHAFAPGPVRDDVVVNTGNWVGAYTADDPMQTVMPSGRLDYQGYAALEMLYHEASHLGVTDTVEQAIVARLPAGRKDPGLWHAVQFYTVGAVTQQVLKQRAGVDYRPYAQAGGVLKRLAGGQTEALLESSWQDYLQGRLGFDEAIAAMSHHLVFKP